MFALKLWHPDSLQWNIDNVPDISTTTRTSAVYKGIQSLTLTSDFYLSWWLIRNHQFNNGQRNKIASSFCNGEKRSQCETWILAGVTHVSQWTSMDSLFRIISVASPRLFYVSYRLLGLMVKASASRAEDPGFKSSLRRDFSGSGHTSDLKIGTPVATLPGSWRPRVSTGTGRSGVSIL